MAPPRSLAEKLAHYFCRLHYEDLPGELVAKVKAYLLDWVGSAVAGTREAPTRIMLSLAAEMKAGKQEATILATGERHLALTAALVNGAAAHVREMDDLHRPAIFHPAAPIMPAVVAAAERSHISGRDLIVAIVAGYEVGIRTALAAGKRHYDLWHTTATCGTFGAAAGAAKAMGLGPEPFSWALGSAGTQAAGLWQFLNDGAMSKQLHTAKAAGNGLLAAMLAAKGFSGPRCIFEGEKGFFAATSPGHDLSRLTHQLGSVFYTEQNALKYYAACGHTHTAIQAALALRDRLGGVTTRVVAITVHLYRQAIDLLGKVKPSTPYLAKFHLPFCVAAALAHGRADLGVFTEERLLEAEIRRLIACTSLQEDGELTRRYPQEWPARVVLVLEDGSKLEEESSYPKGEPENPLTESELIEKFEALCADNLNREARERIVETIMNLEALPDAARLFHGD